jgi:hypothetical protein
MVHEQRVIAIAADYADALLVARRAQRVLLLFLVLIVLAQLAIFFTAHFAEGVLPKLSTASVQAGAVATSQPSVGSRTTADWLQYATAVSLYGGMILSILLVLTLFLTIHIMLVGRLIGVRDVTRSLVLSFVLLFLLMPWQTLLVTRSIDSAAFVLPGILYTWREISERVPLGTPSDIAVQILYWGRFVGLPIVGLIFLLLVQVRSGRGLKYALGEEEIIAADDRDLAR